MGSNDVRALDLEIAPHRDRRTKQADDHAEEDECAVRGIVDLHGHIEAHEADAGSYLWNHQVADCLLYTSGRPRLAVEHPHDEDALGFVHPVHRRHSH